MKTTYNIFFLILILLNPILGNCNQSCYKPSERLTVNVPQSGNIKSFESKAYLYNPYTNSSKPLPSNVPIVFIIPPLSGEKPIFTDKWVARKLCKQGIIVVLTYGDIEYVAKYYGSKNPSVKKKISIQMASDITFLQRGAERTIGALKKFSEVLEKRFIENSNTAPNFNYGCYGASLGSLLCTVVAGKIQLSWKGIAAVAPGTNIPEIMATSSLKLLKRIRNEWMKLNNKNIEEFTNHFDKILTIDPEGSAEVIRDKKIPILQFLTKKDTGIPYKYQELYSMFFKVPEENRIQLNKEHNMGILQVSAFRKNHITEFFKKQLFPSNESSITN